MSPRTIFLSKLLGLYCILIALSMSLQKQATLDSVTALLHNPAMMLVLGVFHIGRRAGDGSGPQSLVARHACRGR